MNKLFARWSQAWSNLSLTEKLLCGAIVLGTILRFAFCIYYNPADAIYSDMKRHWTNSERLFHPLLYNGCDLPVYQVFLFFVQQITRENHLALGIVTGALSCLMPWTYYRAALTLPGLRRGALTIWALTTWTPSLFVIYRYFLVETLLLPMIGLALWQTGRCLTQRSLRSFLLVTIWWTAIALTKPAGVPLALVCVVYAWWQCAHRLQWAALAVAVSGAMMVPNAIRTYQILGFPAPLGSSYISETMFAAGTKHIRVHWESGVWGCSSPSCYIQPLSPLNGWVIERGYGDTMTEFTIHKADGKKGWEEVYRRALANQTHALAQRGENIVLFLFAPSWPDSGRNTVTGSINHWARWMWAPAIFCALFGNWSVFRNREFHLVPVATTALLFVLLVQNSVVMEGRYRKPVEPLILLNLVWLAAYAPSRRTSKYAGS